MRVRTLYGVSAHPLIAFGQSDRFDFLSFYSTKEAEDTLSAFCCPQQSSVRRCRRTPYGGTSDFVTADAVAVLRELRTQIR